MLRQLLQLLAGSKVSALLLPLGLHSSDHLHEVVQALDLLLHGTELLLQALHMLLYGSKLMLQGIKLLEKLVQAPLQLPA